MLLVCPTRRHDELARGAGGPWSEGIAVPLVYIEPAAMVLLLVGSCIVGPPVISFFSNACDIGDPAGDGRPDSVGRLWVGAKPHGDIRMHGDILFIREVGCRGSPQEVAGMV